MLWEDILIKNKNKNNVGEGCPRWRLSKSWNTSSHGHNKPTVSYGTIPSEEPMNQLNSYSTTEGQRAIWTRYETQRCSFSHKSHPHHRDPQLGESHKYRTSPWGARDLCSTSGTPILRICMRNESLKHLLLKTNRGYVQENHRAIGNGDSALKVFSHGLTHPGPRQKEHLGSLYFICDYVKSKITARGVKTFWDSLQGCGSWLCD